MNTRVQFIVDDENDVVVLRNVPIPRKVRGSTYP
jgi:hypothetical protein